MSRQKKQSCAANMAGVPHEELVLAEMIANAEAHGVPFRACTTGLAAHSGRFVPVDDRGCCAIGAYVAFKPVDDMGDDGGYRLFRHMTGLRDADVTTGNDVSSDNHPFVYIVDRTSFDVGAAYRAYHLEAV